MTTDDGKAGEPAKGLSRRRLLQTGGVAAVAASGIAVYANYATSDDSDAAIAADDRPTVTVRVNGQQRQAPVETGTTLVEFLRDTLVLTGTKIGCNQGQCGACTVLLDGHRSTPWTCGSVNHGCRSDPRRRRRSPRQARGRQCTTPA